MKRRNIPSVNQVKYLDVIFDKIFIGTHKLHVAFKIPYVYDFITKLCGQEAEVIQNHENATACNTGQGGGIQRKCRRFKLGGGQAYNLFK
jgi:hypothetical protein